MAVITRVPSQMGLSMALMANTNGQMEGPTKEIGVITILKALGYMNGPMASPMRATGLTIKCMEKVCTNGLMVGFTMETM